jgi:hypothetical protein
MPFPSQEALHRAATNGNESVVKLLIESGEEHIKYWMLRWLP